VTRIDLPKPGQALRGSSPNGRVRMEGKLGHWDLAKKQPDDRKEDDAFAIELLGLISVGFRGVSFDAEYPVGGEPKPKLRPQLGESLFQPPLDIVAKLQDMLPVLGEGFRIEQTAGRSGISDTFIMPAIAFGAVSLRNLSVRSAVLCSREGKPLRFD